MGWLQTTANPERAQHNTCGDRAPRGKCKILDSEYTRDS